MWKPSYLTDEGLVILKVLNLQLFFSINRACDCTSVHKQKGQSTRGWA